MLIAGQNSLCFGLEDIFCDPRRCHHGVSCGGCVGFFVLLLSCLFPFSIGLQCKSHLKTW